MAYTSRWLKIHPYLLVVGLVLLLFFLDFFRIVDFRELEAHDFRLKLRGAERAHSDVVIVEIDDKSLQAMGSWPWPRGYHGDLIERLVEFGSKAIFYDVLFPEVSPDPNQDQKLSDVLEKTNKVIFPFHYYSIEPFDAIFPTPKLLKAVKRLGYANIDIDSDSLVRRVSPWIETSEGIFYHSSVATILSLFDDHQQAKSWLASIPRSSKGYFLINYPGSLEFFNRISFLDVMSDLTEEKKDYLRELFSGKIVLVGQTATATTDLRPTPIAPLLTGIVIQASAVHTLLSGRYLRLPSLWSGYLFVLLLSLGVAWVAKKCKPQVTLLLMPALMVSYTIWNFLVFKYFGLVFLLPLPLIAAGLSYVLTLFLKYLEIKVKDDMLVRELEMASNIQASLLPQSNIQLKGVDIFSKCLFFERVGGDLYDWMELGENKVGVCVGDVSGKGVPAALYMARTLNELRHESASASDPGSVLTRLNSYLVKNATAGMFLTIFFVVIDKAEKKIYFANAGHEWMVYCHKKTKKAEIVSGKQGMPLGILDGISYETAEMNYEPGDFFLLISDGVKEQRNPKGEMYEMERMKRYASRQEESASAEYIIENLFKQIELFARGKAPHDDRTLVCAKMN